MIQATLASLLAPLLALGLFMATDPAEAEPLGDRGLAPYRLNPAPPTLTPPQRGVAEAYRSQLKGDIRELGRSEFDNTPLQQERLRGNRRELNRIERMLDRP